MKQVLQPRQRCSEQPSLHWQALLLAEVNTPMYRTVFCGQAAQDVFPGIVWYASPTLQNIPRAATDSAFGQADTVTADKWG
jgi:hypothetical protein